MRNLPLTMIWVRVQVLETLRKELRLSLALMGCPSLAHVNRHMVLAPWEHPSARL